MKQTARNVRSCRFVLPENELLYCTTVYKNTIRELENKNAGLYRGCYKDRSGYKVYNVGGNWEYKG